MSLLSARYGLSIDLVLRMVSHCCQHCCLCEKFFQAINLPTAFPLCLRLVSMFWSCRVTRSSHRSPEIRNIRVYTTVYITDFPPSTILLGVCWRSNDSEHGLPLLLAMRAPSDSLSSGLYCCQATTKILTKPSDRLYQIPKVLVGKKARNKSLEPPPSGRTPTECS